jgi:RHH-type transcriptional regulator, rel operon repressor / antitoxin RelB
MSESITIRLDTESKRRLEKLAAQTARSKSYVAAEAIRAFLDLNDWQIAEIEAGIREADAGDFAGDAQVQKALTKWQRRAR